MRKLSYKLLAFGITIAFILSPYGASAQDNPVQQFFNGIRSSLSGIKDNKTIIMSIVGAIGIILALIAWGKESSGNDSNLNKVVKGAFVVVILIEVFMFFL